MTKSVILPPVLCPRTLDWLLDQLPSEMHNVSFSGDYEEGYNEGLEACCAVIVTLLEAAEAVGSKAINPLTGEPDDEIESGLGPEFDKEGAPF